MRVAVATFAWAAITVGVISGCSERVGANPTNSTQVARGRQVYQASCAACHGAQMEGQPHWRERQPNGRLPAPPHDASGHTWHHSDQVLFRITKEGPAAVVGGGYESDMPGFAGKLSDDDIWAVLAFIKSAWPEAIRKKQPRTTS